MLKISLHPQADRRIRAGHPWVFSNEIAQLDGPADPGVTCQVHSANGQMLGCGHYNPHSLIAVRLLSRSAKDIDQLDFFLKRIGAAHAYRQTLYPGQDSLRIVHGEGDLLSGLVIDRYDQVISLQLLSAGMERRRELIVEAVKQLFSPVAIVARNDVGVRALEGLSQGVELLYGQLPERVEYRENGLRFEVDILGGQKTGGFLDQKENHRCLQGRVAGRRVLDLFCYSGSWAIHAANYGAAEVTGIDISAAAIALADRNAKANRLEASCSFRAVDAFDELKRLSQQQQRFGAIILDPPAFVKSKKKLREAVRGYLTVNRRAIELLEPGGYLISCSCSYHMGRELFLDTLRQAAAQAGRQLRLLEVRSQAPDHPVLLSCPETEYLKCVIVQAL